MYKDSTVLLCLAISRADTATAVLLLDRGINVDAKDRTGENALLIAIRHGNLDNIPDREFNERMSLFFGKKGDRGTMNTITHHPSPNIQNSILAGQQTITRYCPKQSFSSTVVLRST